jgi:hypothetical protein
MMKTMWPDRRLVFTTANTVHAAARARRPLGKVQYTTTSRGEDEMELIQTAKDDHATGEASHEPAVL